jgi:hypothetical protein
MLKNSPDLGKDKMKQGMGRHCENVRPIFFEKFFFFPGSGKWGSPGQKKGLRDGMARLLDLWNIHLTLADSFSSLLGH